MTDTNNVQNIAQALATQIVIGQYPPNTSLPTEQELAKRYNVSRPTVRGALKWLAGQGLTVSRRGSGHHVTVWWQSASPSILALALAHLDLRSPAGRTLVTDLLDARTPILSNIIDAVCTRREESGLVNAAEILMNLRDPKMILRAEVDVFRAYADSQPNIVLRMSCYNICEALTALWTRTDAVPQDAKAYVEAMHKLHQQIEMTMSEDAVASAKTRWAMHSMELRRTLVG